MKARMWIVGFITFVVGFFLGQARSLVPTDPTLPPPPAPVAAPMPPACSELGALRESIAEHQGVVQGADLAALRERRGEVLATWPDVEMGEVYPSGLEMRLTEAGAEVVYRSCSEYPCVVGARGVTSDQVVGLLTGEGERPSVSERGGYVVVVAPVHPGDERTTKRAAGIMKVLTTL